MRRNRLLKALRSAPAPVLQALECGGLLRQLDGRAVLFHRTLEGWWCENCVVDFALTHGTCGEQCPHLKAFKYGVK